MGKRPEPAVEYLRECFDADFEAGTLTWRVRPEDHFRNEHIWARNTTRYAGKLVSHIDVSGYIVVRVNKRLCQVHRLLWSLAHDDFPPDQIDHINGVKSDNRLDNLRAVSHAQNGRNAKRRRDNTSGVTGVTFFKRDCLWMAGIHLNGRRIHLGYFKILTEAAQARRVAEVKYGFHPNHGKSQHERSAYYGATASTGI